MEKNMRQFIGSLSHYLQDFLISQVVQDFWTINRETIDKPNGKP